MHEIKIIEQRQVLGKDFKVYGNFENPLFHAKEVAAWIDYAKTGKGAYDISHMMSTIDDDEKLIRKLFVSGQIRDSWFLTEDGLYEVLMQSRKPIAKAFKKEVKAVLKTIRKHGAYMTDATIDKIIEDPDFGIRLLENLKAEKIKNAKLQAIADKHEGQTDTVELYNVGDISKEYGISAIKLNTFLYDCRVQYRPNGSSVWQLYTAYADDNLAQTKLVELDNGQCPQFKKTSQQIAF